MSDQKVCITKDCDNPAKIRGLCQQCYTVAINLINTGQTTWEELTTLGLAVKSTRKTGKPFALAFKEAKKKVTAPTDIA